MNAAVAMPTGFAIPEPKKILSARLRLSNHGKIENVIECWKEMAKLEQQPKAAIDAIDATYVVDVLLAKVLDEELAQWSGYARTADQKAAQLAKLREAFEAKKKSDSKSK